MHILTKIDRALAKLEEVLLALLLVSLVVLAAVQVLLRNIWSTSIDWADLTLQNATVLIGLLGAAVATSEGRHLNIDVFGRRLEGRKSFLLRVVIGVFAVFICALLTGGGWETFTANYAPWKANLPEGWSVAKMLKQELSEGSFPQWLSQVLLPIGFGLIGVHFALRLMRDLGSLATGQAWEVQDEKQLDGDAYLDQMLRYAEEGGGEEVDEVVDGDADDGEGDEGDEGGETIADDMSDTLLEDPPEGMKGEGEEEENEAPVAPAPVDDLEDEPEEAQTEFEPRIHREMDRKVREEQEAQAAAEFDAALEEEATGSGKADAKADGKEDTKGGEKADVAAKAEDEAGAAAKAEDKAEAKADTKGNEEDKR